MSSAHVISYDCMAPSWDWPDMQLLGNGRIGALVLGRLGVDVIHFNEDTLWKRITTPRSNPEAKDWLPKVRQLIQDGKVEEAQFLAGMTLMGQSSIASPYQPLGTLQIFLPGEEGKQATDVRRELDMASAIYRLSYTIDEVRYTRECFVSAPDQVFVMRFSADKPAKITVGFNLRREHEDSVIKHDSSTLRLYGRTSDEGVKYESLFHLDSEGAQPFVTGDRAFVENASSLTVTLVARSDFYGDIDLLVSVQSDLNNSLRHDYETRKERHISEHQSWYSRSDLEISNNTRVTELFNFSKYLTIAGSRPGTLPMNLQGIWNHEMTPPWSSDYHLNINIQMNYWLAEVCDLGDCHIPLFEWMNVLAQEGAVTARDHYGCAGWVANHVSDPWGHSVPSDGAGCGIWPTGGVWLCDHLWEHWLYTHDTDFLRDTAYPLLLGAAKFFLDYLVENDKGELVCGPSCSPENRYRTKDGQVAALCMGPAMDQQLIRGLFEDVLQSAQILNIHDSVHSRISESLSRLFDPGIDPHNGQIIEWDKHSLEYDEIEPTHRHISHLYDLHPGRRISPRKTPILAEAAKRSLDTRIGPRTTSAGWSTIVISALASRLGQASRAWDFAQGHINDIKGKMIPTPSGHMYQRPIFQIDSPLGFGAAIIEMLLQSHDGINLLPAMPEQLSTGSFTGLKARGAVKIDMDWADGKVMKVQLCSDIDQNLSIRGPGLAKLTCMKRDNPVSVSHEEADMISLSVESGQTYILS